MREYINTFYLWKTEVRLRYLLGSIYMTIRLKLNGVLTEGLVYSTGRFNCVRYPNSIIEIARNVRFNNHSRTNLIGVNRCNTLSTFSSDAWLKIGENTGITGSTISSMCGITIGSNVKVGSNCIIIDHDFHPEDSRSGMPRPIIIQDNVWIGVNCIILKGSVIGENSLVAANTIISGHYPPNCVISGAKGEVIKAL